jgi:hypothetical protein
MTKNTWFDKATQLLLPSLTITGFLLTSLKRPDLGLLFNFTAQIFWLYSGWQAWKKAGQIGIFLTTIVLTLIVSFGIINYWFFT